MHGKTRYPPTVGFLLPFVFAASKKWLRFFWGLILWMLSIGRARHPVLDGRVREEDKLGNDAADEAADFGRRKVGNAVNDARRNLFGVCGRWYPVLLDLHRFFIAIFRAVVNHDGTDGTAPDPLVWSAGAGPKWRRLVHAVRDRAFLPVPPGIWESEWVNVPASAICAEDIAWWPYTTGLLVKWVSFVGSLHWPAGGLDLGVGGISYVELFSMNFELVRDFL